MFWRIDPSVTPHLSRRQHILRNQPDLTSFITCLCGSSSITEKLTQFLESSNIESNIYYSLEVWRSLSVAFWRKFLTTGHLAIWDRARQPYKKRRISVSTTERYSSMHKLGEFTHSKNKLIFGIALHFLTKISYSYKVWRSLSGAFWWIFLTAGHLVHLRPCPAVWSEA